MDLLFLGGAREIGASATLCAVADLAVLVDAGARPGRSGRSADPTWEAAEGMPTPHAILLTHAHYDHIGALVRYHRRHPQLPIYATAATIDLARLALADGLRVAEREGGERDDVTAEDIHQTLAAMRLLPWLTPTPVAQSSAGLLVVTAARAGHIPGAACLYLEAHRAGGTHVLRAVFTGDVSLREQPILPGADVAAMGQWRPHVVVCEGTYGTERHRDPHEEEGRLLQAIGETVQRGGTALVPAFAIGRAQNVLALVREALDGSPRWRDVWPAGWRFPATRVWVDGLCREATALLEDHGGLLSARWRAYAARDGGLLFDRQGRIRMVRTPGERERLQQGLEPSIIVSSSGMLTGGASVGYARALAADRSGRHGIFLSGYVDEESPGALLRDTVRSGAREWVVGGEPLAVHCTVAQYSLSAHADGEELGRLLGLWSPALVALVHGTPGRLEGLADAARAIPGLRRADIRVPAVGERLRIGAPDPGGVRWPTPGQSEWVMHAVIGRLVDDGEAAVWHGHLGRTAFLSDTPQGVSLDVHPGPPSALPMLGLGPQAPELKLHGETVALRGKGLEVRSLGERHVVQAAEASGLQNARPRVQALIGRGVRASDEGYHRERVATWDLAPGDVVLVMQAAGGQQGLMPGIVLEVEGAHVRAFLPQGADTRVAAWQLVQALGRWPLWRGTAWPLTLVDWILLDALAVGFAGGTSAETADPLRGLWEQVAQGHFPVQDAVATSLALLDQGTSVDAMASAWGRAGGAPGELDAWLGRLEIGGWGERTGATGWRWLPPDLGRWILWPAGARLRLAQARRTALAYLAQVGVRRGALGGGAPPG